MRGTRIERESRVWLRMAFALCVSGGRAPKGCSPYIENSAVTARVAAEQEREIERRRTRQKSRGQKVRMIQSKKYRAKTKSRRGRVDSE